MIAALIAALPALTAAALAWHNQRKLREIHVLVNSNLAAVVEKLARVTVERDEARERGK